VMCARNAIMVQKETQKFVLRCCYVMYSLRRDVNRQQQRSDAQNSTYYITKIISRKRRKSAFHGG